MTHPFDDAIALAPLATGQWQGRTSAVYANMVGPFGGTTAAVLLQAVLQHPQRQGEPIAQTVNYLAPVADGAFDLAAQPVRTNRSTQHWLVQLLQGGEVAANATVVLALRRDTWGAAELAPHDVPAAASLPRAPTTGLPAWTRAYDMRFIPGEEPWPFDGQERAHATTRLWVRDEPERPLDFASLASLCDVFLPRIYVRRRQRTPIGTVSLTTYFHADAARLAEQGARPVLGVARAQAYHRGFFDQSAEVWGDGGVLLASTHQIVYFKG